MPRTTIEIPFSRVEHLSILDPEGHVDKELEPDLDRDFLVRLYRAMLLGRKFDERQLSLQRQGRIGTFAPITGQEAQIGAVAALQPSDWFAPSFREVAAQLWRGDRMESILIHNGGYKDPGGEEEPGERNNNLPVAVPVASQALHAVGLAWAARYRKKKEVVMACFGDGGTSEGDFHEALNFAAVYQAPVVFFCQNNHWAISVPIERQTRSKTLAQKAVAYGMPGIQVDGNDVLAVYSAAKEAVERARSGGGPTLIESVTFRMLMHTTADDPKRYRKEEVVTEWKERDPLIRFGKYLTAKGVPDEKLAGLEEEVLKEVQSAVDKAEEKMKKLEPLSLGMFDHIFAEPPPVLLEQREELVRELKETGGEKHG